MKRLMKGQLKVVLCGWVLLLLPIVSLAAGNEFMPGLKFCVLLSLIFFGLALMNRWAKDKPSTSENKADPYMLARSAYFSRLKEGRGQGFYMVFFVDPDRTDEAADVMDKIIATFGQRFFSAESIGGAFPDAHVHGADYKIPGFTLLVGHPIPLDPEHQLDMVKKYVKAWYKMVDQISNGQLKGAMSLAYGDIDYKRPETPFDRAMFVGSFPTLHQGRYRMQSTFPKHGPQTMSIIALQ